MIGSENELIMISVVGECCFIFGELHASAAWTTTANNKTLSELDLLDI